MSTVFQVERDRIQGDIRFRDLDHSYTHIPTGKKLTSVSRVISTVYSIKSWDGVKPEIIENAKLRGIAIDRLLSEYVRERVLSLNPVDPYDEEALDLRLRILTAHRIWEDEFSGLPAEPQLIVYNLVDGIAGTMDFFVDRRVVVDLKNTYSKEPGSWALQIGAYCSYAPAPVERAGIIHISPKVYTKDGGRWLEYDVDECRKYWRMAVEWWKETQLMKGEKR